MMTFSHQLTSPKSCLCMVTKTDCKQKCISMGENEHVRTWYEIVRSAIIPVRKGNGTTINRELWYTIPPNDTRTYPWYYIPGIYQVYIYIHIFFLIIFTFQPNS